MFNTQKKLTFGIATAAVAFSGSAMAQVDLDLDTPVVPVYASEFDASAADPLALTHAGVTSGATIAINAETLRYVRYDLGGGATFGAAAPALAVAGPNTAPAILLVEGGAAGDEFAIFSLETAAAGDGDNNRVGFGDDFTLTSNFEVVDSSTTVSVTVGIYETQADASTGGTPLGSAITGNIISWGSGVEVNFTPSDASADVTTNFDDFVVSGDTTATTADLGNFEIIPAAGVLAPDDGMAVALADLVTAAEIVVTGDFTLTADADGHVQDGLLSFAGSADAAETLTDTTLTLADADGAVASAAFTITRSGENPILESTYSVVVSFTEVAGRTVADASGSMGEITRGGANVDIPYITTFSDYNQRLIIVNRGNVDAAYTITFTSEDGVTATAGTAATGAVPAGETLIVRMTDVVTLDGGTRTAGQINIIATAGNVDVATTQVNLGDTSTDTVVLQ